MPEAVEEDSTTITPACKKPRLADNVAWNLELTPPPVTGTHTDPCFLFKLFLEVGCVLCLVPKKGDFIY